MSGYDGYSMSNNARWCHDNGILPLSKFTKTMVMKQAKEYLIDIDKQELIEPLKKFNAVSRKVFLLKYSEWHHTSSAYNKTLFYCLDYEFLDGLTIDKLNSIIENQPKSKKKTLEVKQGYVHGEYTVTEYHPFSKYNKYSSYQVPFKNGIIKGNWVILANGKRKALHNCKIEKTTKIRRK